MTIRFQCYMGLLFCGAGGCHHPPVRQLLPAGSGAVTLDVDSIREPALARFPLRLRLTNTTRHPVVLVFNTGAPERFQFNTLYSNTLYMVAGRDTFFLGVPTKSPHLVFPANTATSFLGWGYFARGDGAFDSFRQIDTVFQAGTLVYALPASGLPGVNLADLPRSGDTLLFPTKMAARTAHAPVVERFWPGSMTWREKRLP